METSEPRNVREYSQALMNCHGRQAPSPFPLPQGARGKILRIAQDDRRGLSPSTYAWKPMRRGGGKNRKGTSHFSASALKAVPARPGGKRSCAPFIPV